MRSTIQIDAAFPTSSPAQRIRRDLGVIGLLTFDMAFRRSAQDHAFVFSHLNNEPSLCADIGLPGFSLRDEAGRPWTPDDLWELTGRLKLTRCEHDGGLAIVQFPGFVERYVRRQRLTIPAAVRQAVLERDEFCCVQCGHTEDLQMDHRFPWSWGGEDSIENLQTLCGRCNRMKRDKVEP